MRRAFVRPELVAEVEFRGWTAARSLRHASFRGLRDDKAAADVVRETEPAPMPASPNPASPSRLAQSARPPSPAIGEADPSRPPVLARCRDHQGGPGGLLRRHVAMDGAVHRRPAAEPAALPGRRRRAMLLPEACLARAPPQHPPVQGPAGPGGEELLSIGDLDGLVALVQAGALEIHPWGATVARPDQPDWLTFDLDPGEGVAWDAVVAAAREVRQRLTALGLSAFVKTSGGKGLHVVAPLEAAADWDAAKAFAKRLAASMAADAPGRYLATATKAKRTARISSTICATPAGRRRWPPIPPVPGPAPPFRCRWPGTNWGRISARPISPWPTA